MTDNPLDPAGDPFGPPEISVEVGCLHCRQTYDSYLIEWRVRTDVDGNQHGFWCCPTPGCSGMGFGFDILPTDPNYRDERGGWMQCDDESDEDDFDEDDFDEDDFDTDALGGNAFDADFTSDAPTDGPKPSGNGHGRPKLADEGDDQIPY